MRVLLSLVLLLAGAGCARVKPWQREHLGKRCMLSRFGEEGVMAAAYQAKSLEAVTGGGLPGDAPGGGCGCTQ